MRKHNLEMQRNQVKRNKKRGEKLTSILYSISTIQEKNLIKTLDATFITIYTLHTKTAQDLNLFCTVHFKKNVGSISCYKLKKGNNNKLVLYTKFQIVISIVYVHG